MLTYITTQSPLLNYAQAFFPINNHHFKVTKSTIRKTNTNHRRQQFIYMFSRTFKHRSLLSLAQSTTTSERINTPIYNRFNAHDKLSAINHKFNASVLFIMPIKRWKNVTVINRKCHNLTIHIHLDWLGYPCTESNWTSINHTGLNRNLPHSEMTCVTYKASKNLPANDRLQYDLTVSPFTQFNSYTHLAVLLHDNTDSSFDRHTILLPVSKLSLALYDLHQERNHQQITKCKDNT